MSDRNTNMTKPQSLALAIGLEIAIYALFLAVIMVPGGWILIASVLLLGAAALAMRRIPAMGEQVREAFAVHSRAVWIVGIVLVLLIPIFVASSPYWLFIIISAGLFLIACLGLNLQLGSAGMVNLAAAAFYAVGAYTAGLLALRMGLPPWLTLLLGAVVTGVFSILLFVPVLKTKGHYLALVTIAFQFMVTILLDNMEWTGGPQGLKNIPQFSIIGYSFNTEIKLGFITLSAYANYYYLMIVLVAAVAIASQRIYNSWVGVTLSTIRDDEIAAQTFGVRVDRWKLVIFTLGNCFIGLAGAFYAHLVGFISPPSFAFDKSLIMVSIVILGGMDNVFGVVVGSLLLILLPEKLRAVQEYRFLIYGIVLIVMLIFRPKGIIPFKARDFMDLIRSADPKGTSTASSETAEGGV